MHQNSYDIIDAYTPLLKQFYILKSILAYNEACTKAIEKGALIKDIENMKAREKIGRAKYLLNDNFKNDFEELLREIALEAEGLTEGR